MTSQDVQAAVELLRALRGTYQHLVSYHHRLAPRMAGGELEEAEGTDLGFLHREMEEIADEIRKECAVRKDLIGRILAVKITRRAVESPSAMLSSQGELATASPDIKMRPIIPKRGTPEYAILMRWLGASEETIENGLASPHYPRLSEWMTRLAESGRPMPPGLLGTRPEPQVTFRSRKKDRE